MWRYFYDRRVHLSLQIVRLRLAPPNLFDLFPKI